MLTGALVTCQSSSSSIRLSPAIPCFLPRRQCCRLDSVKSHPSLASVASAASCCIGPSLISALIGKSIGLTLDQRHLSQTFIHFLFLFIQLEGRCKMQVNVKCTRSRRPPTMKLSAGARRFLLLTVLHMVLQCSHSHMASAQPHLPLAMSDPPAIHLPSCVGSVSADEEPTHSLTGRAAFDLKLCFVDFFRFGRPRSKGRLLSTSR